MTVTRPDGLVLLAITRHVESPARVVLRVTGEVDTDTAPLLLVALTSAITHRIGVCCDLTEVGFFGAAGANTVAAGLNHAARTGCAFTVRGAHGLTARVLRIAGLEVVLGSAAESV